jgi:translation initiation factor 5B
MAPKKKGSKKGNDDWEAELGESIAVPAPAADPAAGAQDTNDAEETGAGGGGLMGLMRKKKEKRKQKGLSEDFVEGEDPPSAVPASEPAQDPTMKAPEEANLDDEFALPEKKGKAGKGKQAQPVAAAKATPGAAPAGADDGDQEEADGGRVLTKAEKERLKKEKDKQRKKEQVCLQATHTLPSCVELTLLLSGRQEES